MKKIITLLIVSIVSAAHGNGVSVQEVIESIKTPAARDALDQRLMAEKKRQNDADYKRSLSHLLEKVLKSDIPGSQKVAAADYLLTKGAYIATYNYLPMGNNKQLMDEFIEKYGLDTIRSRAGDRFWYGLFNTKANIENKAGTDFGRTINGAPMLVDLAALKIIGDTIEATAQFNEFLGKYTKLVPNGQDWLGLSYSYNPDDKIYSQLGIFKFNPTTLKTSSLELFNMPYEVANGKAIIFMRLYPITKPGTPEYVLIIGTGELPTAETTDVHFYSVTAGNPEPQLLGTLANRNTREIHKAIGAFEEYYYYTGK